MFYVQIVKFMHLYFVRYETNWNHSWKKRITLQVEMYLFVQVNVTGDPALPS